MVQLLKISRESLVTGVGVILRVPSVFLLEAWYRTNPLKAVAIHTRDVEIIVTVVYYMALLLAVAIGGLPIKKLVTFYMYLVSCLLLVGSYYLSRSFIEGEISELQMEQESWTSLLEDRTRVERLFLHLIAQGFIAAVVAYLVEMVNWTRFLLLVFTLPIIARAMGLPLETVQVLHNFAAVFTTLILLLYILNNLGYMIDNMKDVINTAIMALRTFGVFPVVLSFWHSVCLPAQLVVFWLILLGAQFFYYLTSESHPILQESWTIIVLASVGECCATPISLFALCVTITYASYSILTLTRLYLQGFEAWSQDTDVVRGWTEGFTMLLIALQTDLLELRPLQRAFLMSILFFIVASAMIQSLYEVTEPVLLALSASHNRSIFKHSRAVLLCMLLWILPLYMTYTICQYFDLDFWLLVIISSCMLTSVQVIGSLVVYTLFMYDSMRLEPWENLDDIIYVARSITRVMEFVVAVFVVCYGLKESFYGEWSLINSSILVIHCYFNVWQRLQSGWKSFLLRREAVKKVESLPAASAEQLNSLNDVCAICYNEMKSARVTPCGHFFHSLCLRKWLYVKESCPMCHQEIHKGIRATPTAAHNEVNRVPQNIPEASAASVEGHQDGHSRDGVEGNVIPQSDRNTPADGGYSDDRRLSGAESNTADINMQTSNRTAVDNAQAGIQ